MKNVIKIVTVCGLAFSAAYGQNSTGDVQSIMKELAKPSVVAAPENVAPAAVDVPVVIEQSREQYVAGDYEAARAGFQRVLVAEPNNPVARYYLGKMADKKQMSAKESAIHEVKNAWNGMIFRDYPLSAKARQALRVADETNSVDVATAFPEVAFPKNAYALYRPQLNRLFVLNTRSNIERLESIIASMEAPRQGDAGQVEIEARFVEFSEGALQELGFKWSDATGGNGVDLDGNWSINDEQDLFSGALRSMPFDQTGALGLGERRVTGNGTTTRIEDTFNSTATGSGTLGVSGKVGGNAVDLLIRALDQASGVDVLSAPSVVTLSGQPAVITVGERHFYPAVYEAGSSQGTVLHVKYQDFTEKILGVEMTVTPTIKGDEIQMKINPKINELLGWQQFELAPADSSYTYYQYRVGMQFEHEPVVAQLPLFNRREVKTEVSVASGATIGMGGLIGEKTEAFSDRVPVLGSIPLVGRLFRSEGERTVKRNLMIFVTASKVNPNGRIISERSFE